MKEIFVDFLKSFGELKYRKRISGLTGTGGRSIIVEYQDLEEFNSDLAADLRLDPATILQCFDEALVETLQIEDPSYAEKRKRELRIRIRGLEPRPLSSLDPEYLFQLLAVCGIVMQASYQVSPLITEAAFTCANGHVSRVPQNYVESTKIMRPLKCDTEGCGETRNFKLNMRKSFFTNFQKLGVQEMPELTPPGQIASVHEIIATGDLVNTVRPGDRICVVGVLEAMRSDNGPSESQSLIPKSTLFANSLEVVGKRPEDVEISAEEEKEIREFANQPDLMGRLIRSVCPEIRGHDLPKEAVLYLLAGSESVILPDGSTLRGNISVLLLGDPGVSKSLLGKAVWRLSPRSVYVNAANTTRPGIASAVVRGDASGVFVVKAGAVILADLGILVVDEAKWLPPEAKNALNEPMEQQTESLAMAGYNLNLNARIGVLSITNPTDDQYRLVQEFARQSGRVPNPAPNSI